MNWNEMKGVWQGQSGPALAAARLAELEREFTARQRKFARMRFWRDVSEAAAGVLVAAVMASVGWRMGAAGWPIGLAVLAILGLSAFFVRERVRARRAEAAPGAALRERVEREYAELQRQHRLLSQVAGWYLGPSFLAGGIFGATVLGQAPAPVAAKWLVAALMLAVFALTGWAIVAVNRRAVRRVLEPRLRELEAMRAQWTERPGESS